MHGRSFVPDTLFGENAGESYTSVFKQRWISYVNDDKGEAGSLGEQTSTYKDPFSSVTPRKTVANSKPREDSREHF